MVLRVERTNTREIITVQDRKNPQGLKREVRKARKRRRGKKLI